MNVYCPLLAEMEQLVKILMVLTTVFAPRVTKELTAISIQMIVHHVSLAFCKLLFF